jgi:hypothetical protein
MVIGGCLCMYVCLHGYVSLPMTFFCLSLLCCPFADLPPVLGKAELDGRARQV